jgi:hypothetical protein
MMAIMKEKLPSGRARKTGRRPLTEEEKAKEKLRLQRAYQLRKEVQQARRDAKRKAHPEIFAARQKRWRDKQTPEYIEKDLEKRRERYYRNHAEELSRRRAARERARLEMIAIFGGACECCGETNPRFLTLDHINGDGRAHRAMAGGSGNIVFNLKARGWPKEGYRLLCFNCNCGRAYNGGVCPHITANSK